MCISFAKNASYWRIFLSLISRFVTHFWVTVKGGFLGALFGAKLGVNAWVQILGRIGVIIGE